MREEIKQPVERVQRIIAKVLPIVAIAMAVYHLAFTQYLLQGATGHRITHLGFAFVVVLLSLLLQSKRGWLLKWGLLLASLAVSGYLMFYLDDILEFRSTIPTAWDQIIGVAGILLTVAASFLVFGKTFHEDSSGLYFHFSNGMSSVDIFILPLSSLAIIHLSQFLSSRNGWSSR